ncbi:MAG: hypothetical protein HRU19_26230 [Pseudobacteriovorax sp.]|nr:hypothetical protein [Pseudobacteriovorax sp.]
MSCSSLAEARFDSTVGFGTGSLSYKPSNETENQDFTISVLDYRLRYLIRPQQSSGWGLAVGLSYEASLAQIVREQYEVFYRWTLMGGVSLAHHHNDLYQAQSRNPWALVVNQRVGMHNYSIGIEQTGFQDIKGSKIQATTELEYVYHDLFGLNFGLGGFFEVLGLPLSVDAVGTQLFGTFVSLSRTF